MGQIRTDSKDCTTAAHAVKTDPPTLRENVIVRIRSCSSRVNDPYRGEVFADGSVRAATASRRHLNGLPVKSFCCAELQLTKSTQNVLPENCDDAGSP